MALLAAELPELPALRANRARLEALRAMMTAEFFQTVTGVVPWVWHRRMLGLVGPQRPPAQLGPLAGQAGWLVEVFLFLGAGRDQMAGCTQTEEKQQAAVHQGALEILFLKRKLTDKKAFLD